MKFNFKLKTAALAFSFFFLYFSSATALDDFEEIIDYSQLDFDELEQYETRSADEKDFANAIINLAPEIQTPLWNHTKPPKGRDILYLLPTKISSLEYGGIILNFLFNYTPKMNFSTDETLKLSENEKLLETLVEEMNKIVSSEDASSLIPLFKKLTIQERKLGVLIQAGFTFNAFSLQVHTSVQFSERNFWLNKNDQDEIKQLFQDDNSTFDTKELYKSKFGIGDTRIKLGLNTLNASSAQIDIGLEGILPTAPKSNLPTLTNENINFSNIVDSLSEILGGIRDNLINPRLGNNGHFGLGCFIEAKIDLFHKSLQWWNRVSFDSLFPAKENRLIPSKQTMAAPGDMDYADALTYLADINTDETKQTEFIKEYIFPPPYRVSVDPGAIITFVSKITFDLDKKWTFGVGYDFYMQQHEQFENIYNSNVEINTLRIDDAESPTALQHKIFGDINYTKKQKGWDLKLGGGGDYTIASRQMGQDWTIFIRIGASF